MSSPLVSVVIPAYNHERFIGAAVESVLKQTCSDLELIVIDDGSTDKTGEIIQGYTDPRLTYTYQENQDAYNTINRGMGKARGEYIAILNSDDIYTLDRLERLLEYRQETGAECVFTDIMLISHTGEVFVDHDFGRDMNKWHQKNKTFFKQSGDIYTAFLHGNLMITTSNLFMTARATRKVGNFCSLRYLHDYDYIFRMMLAHPGKVHYLENEKLLYYRIHSGNTLGEAAIIGREQDQELIKKYMLKALPESYRKYAKVGADRLVELDRELEEVRNVIDPPYIGIRPAAKVFIRNIIMWIKKKLKGSHKKS